MGLEKCNNTKFQTAVLEDVERSNIIQYHGPFFPEMQHTYWSTADELFVIL